MDQPTNRVRIDDVRLRYGAVFKKETVKGVADSTPAYSATVIIPKDHPAVPKILALMKTLVKEEWPSKADDMWTEIKAKDKFCLHDGDAKASVDGFKGNLYLSARHPDKRPDAFGPDKSVLTEDTDPFYRGCYVTVVVDLFAYSKGSNGVGARLMGIQFRKDGEPFADSGVVNGDAFEAVAGAEGSKAGDPAASVFD